MPELRDLHAFPPAGTTCEDCGLRPAAVYAGNAAICWQCDGQGTIGAASTEPQTAAAPESPAKPSGAKPAHTKIQRAARELSSQREAVSKTPQPAPAPAKTSTAKRVSMNQKTSDEVRQAILAAPGVPVAELARRHGISQSTVYNIRLQARPAAPVEIGPVTAEPLPAADLPPANQPTAAEIFSDLQNSQIVSETLNAPPANEEKFWISFATDLTLAELDAFWSGLEPAQKVELVRHAIIVTLHRTIHDLTHPHTQAQPQGESHA